MAEVTNKKTYSTFGIGRSWLQIKQSLTDRRNAEQNMALLFQRVRLAEMRMSDRSGKPVENLRILEIGPGQGLERARYFGIKNQVIGLDLDVIPIKSSPAEYYRVFRENGMGRLIKTIGRKVILGKANERAWSKAVGVGLMKAPQMYQANVCGPLPDLGHFDLVMSWSAFEHFPDPRQALKNIINLLNPGGIFYLSIHLYTSHNGHHDIRAFTGQEEKLPPWGHLRENTKDQIHPSAYLNQWRLVQWREMFKEMAPGFHEYLEKGLNSNGFGTSIPPEICAELNQYSDEELFTVDAVYCWQKPYLKGEAPNAS